MSVYVFLIKLFFRFCELDDVVYVSVCVSLSVVSIRDSRKLGLWDLAGMIHITD